jgi:hypothetical protein
VSSVPPPLFNANTTYKVGEMFGLGPTPGWQYTNGLKVGVNRTPIPYTNPVQYYEEDIIEYIHPCWDATLDYSKEKMPKRVWFNGMLYSPGVWLTTAKKGLKPNEAEAGMGDPKFRVSMNNPALDYDKLYRPVNQSHPVRVWMPYSRRPTEKDVRQDYYRPYISEPDGPVIYAAPCCTAHEGLHVTSTDNRQSKYYFPHPNGPYQNEIKPRYDYDPIHGGKMFKAKGYVNDDTTPIDVSFRTGKMTTFGVCAVNAESAWGIAYPWYGTTHWEYHKYRGVSYTGLYKESAVTNIENKRKDPTEPNYPPTWSDVESLSIGGGASDDRLHVVGDFNGPLDFEEVLNPDNSYTSSARTALDYCTDQNFRSAVSESCLKKNGNYYDLTDDCNLNDNRSSGNSHYQKYGTKYILNYYILPTHPFVFTREAKYQEEIDEYKSFEKITYSNCKYTYSWDGTIRSVSVGTNGTIAPAKRHSISVGANNEKEGVTSGFNHNTYYNDAHSLKKGNYLYYSIVESDGHNTDHPYPECDSGWTTYKTTNYSQLGGQTYGWVQ